MSRQVTAGIIPGTQMARVISAVPGGRAEQLLRAMAESLEGFRTGRKFDSWVPSGDESEECEGRVVHAGEGRDVTLRIGGAPGDIVLIDVPEGTSWRPMATKDGPVVEVSEIPEKRLGTIANNIIAICVVHGVGWRDRHGREHLSPYGGGNQLPTAATVRRRSRYRRRQDERDAAQNACSNP